MGFIKRSWEFSSRIRPNGWHVFTGSFFGRRLEEGSISEGFCCLMGFLWVEKGGLLIGKKQVGD